ncbi:MAG: hypothetical protein ACE5IK_02425 [Acidobacteriota bacterium]
MGIDLLVYGFSRQPGALPEIMNVGVGGLRIRFRGLAEDPSFTGHDAVVMPFDTYHPWMDGTEGISCMSAVLLRTRLELLRAAEAGVNIGFLYEDCFAHFTDPEELQQMSLGAMTLSGLGLRPERLPAPEDDLDVLAAPFDDYLRRFGIAESYFESDHPAPRLHPLCRTSDHRITGVAADEGAGRILFLPGDPRNRFLDFFTSLGGALGQFGHPEAAAGAYVFASERQLLAQQARVIEQQEHLDQRLDRFRRRREMLALVSADPDRFLPEWFATFLDLELQPTDEPGCFHWAAPPGSAGARALVAVAVRSAADALIAVGEIRDEQFRSGVLAPEAPAFLYLTEESLVASRNGAGDLSGTFDLSGEAGSMDVHLLRAADLFGLLDEKDRLDRQIDVVDLVRAAGGDRIPTPGG